MPGKSVGDGNTGESRASPSFILYFILFLNIFSFKKILSYNSKNSNLLNFYVKEIYIIKGKRFSIYF